MSASSVRCVSRLQVLISAVFCGLFILCLPGTAKAQVSLLSGSGISTVAGTGTAGYSGDGGPATNAALRRPHGVALDAAGNLYIADQFNNRVRKVDGAGTVSTVAGNGTAGHSGDGGSATSAQLFSPTGVAVDSAGNLYIAEYDNHRIRKVDAATGTIRTVAGTGSRGYNGDGRLATRAWLKEPSGVAVDSTGNLYIADSGNNRIRKVDAATGIITTVAGTGAFGSGGDGGAATDAQFRSPVGVAVDGAGNLYIVDLLNSRIHKVDAATGTIRSVAGNGGANYSGDGGPATSAGLANPWDVALDGAGNLYIADFNNDRIRKVDAAGRITTVAGNGTRGYGGDGGPATSAQLYQPAGVAVDAAGNLYIADTSNQRIRKVASSGFPKTAVGSISEPQNVILQLDAAQSITSFTAVTSQGGKQEFVVGAITGCVVDGSTINASGTICTVLITFVPGYPGQRNVPLKVLTNTGTYSVGLSGTGTGPQVAFTPGIISTVAGNGTSGSGGDGGPATSAQLSDPYGVAMDGAGNLYIAEYNNHRIRKVDAAGTIRTVAGNGTAGYSGDGGPATSARVLFPHGVAVDAAGNLYIADHNNDRIRKVDAAGTITTVAGTGTAGSFGDGGPATSAQLAGPAGVAVDSVGNLYIADGSNNRIRKVDAAGTITTVAGTGTAGYSGDGGPAANAQLVNPHGVAVDDAGNLYIADTYNNRIRKVDAAGTISTVAGGGFGGDGGPATSAFLGGPTGVAVDAAGNLYITDTGNRRMRMVDAATRTITTVAGTTSGYSGDGGLATKAQLETPFGVAVDSTGHLYIADRNNQRVRKVDVSTSVIRFNTATNVGSVDTADGPQTVVFSNIGNADLHIPILAGPNPNISANFTLNACARLTYEYTGVLISGESCGLSVTFAPQSVGSIAGTLTVTDDALNVISGGIPAATQTVALSGTGLAAAPTINFSVPGAHTITDQPFAVNATSNSSGAITYSVVSGGATISGNIVTLTGVGFVTLRASQAANGNYTAGTATTTIDVLSGTPPSTP